MLLRLLAFLICLTFVQHNFAQFIPADLLFKSREVSVLQFSPSGAYFSQQILTDDYSILELVNVESMEATTIFHLSREDGALIIRHSWLDSATISVVYRSIRGVLRGGIFDLNFESEIPTATAKNRTARGYIVSTMPQVKGQVLYARALDNSGFQEYFLYKVSPEQIATNKFKTTDRLTTGLKRASAYYGNRDATELFAVTHKEPKSTIWYRTASNPKWRKIYTTELEDEKFTPVGTLKNGKLAVITDQLSDTISLYEFDMDSGQWGNLLYQHARYDLEDAEVDPQTKRLLNVTYISHGQRETHYFADNDSELYEKLGRAFKGKQIITIDESKNGEHKIISTYASDQAAKYYLMNTKKLKVELIGATQPGLDDYKLSKTEALTVTAKDGAKVEALLTRPNQTNGVLIVNPHGGPIGVRDADRFNPKVEYLANRGYTVLRVNFRGSSGFGKKFETQGRGEFGKFIESDITQVVNQVMEENDFKHICSMGASYGGYSSLILAIKHPETYNCVIARYGVYDLPLLFNTNNLRRSEEYIKSMSRVVGPMREALWNVSPLYLLDQLQAPILVTAGEDDRITVIEQSNRLKFRLNQLGKDAEYLFFDGVGHGHYSWDGERFEMDFIDDYLRKTLSIPLPTDEKSLSVMAKSHAHIGAYHLNDTYIDPNTKKALSYLIPAAKAGDIDAQLSLGKHFGNHNESTFDFFAAEKWLLMAASQKDKHGYYLLGQLYLNRNEKDYFERAIINLTKAKELNQNLAVLDLAKAACLGRGVSLDITACFAALDELQETNPNKRQTRRLRGILIELLWSDDLDEKLLTGIKSFLTSHNDVIDTRLKSLTISQGLYKRFNPPYSFAYHVDDSTLIPLEEDMLFGAELKITGRKTNSKEKIAVKFRWTKPMNDSADKPRKYHSFAIVNSHAAFSYRYVLDTDEDMVEGDWTLEVQTLDGTELYKNTFTTKKVDEEDF